MPNALQVLRQICVSAGAVVKTVLMALACLTGATLSFPCRSSAASELPRGYIQDVKSERDEVSKELVWISKPGSEPMLRDRIFNETLSREFRERYEQRFGRTEIERVALAPNRLTYYNDSFGLKGTPQEISDERRRFGEFMVRRLAEWHVENYAKNDPSVRPLWEAKEQISNVKVEVASFSIDAQYSIAGNTLDVNVKNPWVQSKVTLLMNPDQFGPGEINETLVSIVKPVTSKYTVEGRWRVNDGIASIIQYRPLPMGWMGSFTTSAAIKDGGPSRRETLWLAGAGKAF